MSESVAPPQRKGVAFVEHEPSTNDLLVGYRRGEYHGPVARVSSDANWLHIVTDAYDGHAMLNIEALPALRRALARIARKRKRPCFSPSARS